MKKLFLLVICLWGLALGEVKAQSLKKEVIIFSQPCTFCEKMKNDLNNGIMFNNPDMAFVILDIREPKNRQLFQKFADEYGLMGNVGLPLIFVGNNYLMGWGEGSGKLLQKYIDEYKSEPITRISYKVLLDNL